MARPKGSKDTKGQITTISRKCEHCEKDFTKTLKSKHAQFLRFCSSYCRDRAGQLRRLYNLTLNDIENKIKNQRNLCSICKIDLKTIPNNRINVDHCHSSGKVRDILCSKCNSGLGSFEDSEILLKAAIDYLKRHKNV